MFPPFILSKRSAHRFGFGSMQFLSWRQSPEIVHMCSWEITEYTQQMIKSVKWLFCLQKAHKPSQTKPFSSFAFVSYLISFSSLRSSILKLFYLQEDFNVFWNTICRKDAKYKLYSLDLHAFAILHEHAHICSISKQQVFSKVLLLLVRNDHITQQYQSQVLSKASLAKKLKSLIISSDIQPCFGVVALPDNSKMWQWSTFTLKKHLTIAFSVVSPLLFVQSRALTWAR